MTRKQTLLLGVLAIAIVLAWAGSVVTLGAQQAASGAPRIDGDDIGGVGPRASGARAGGWGVAGTNGLPTRVAPGGGTDQQGPHAVAPAPQARYQGVGRGDRL